VLRHRFWQSGEHGRVHTGARYIGIVMHDAAGEACPMELRLASRDIGRVEPARHDNRRHLIVVDRPVTFMGGMEVFQLRAPGKGVYRIEAFVLLRERPASSRFTPRIRRLAVAPESAAALTVCFTTDEVAACVVEALADGRLVARAESAHPAKLHAIPLAGLASGDCTLRVTAVEQAGETATAELRCSPGRVAPRSQPVSAPVELFNLAGQDAMGLPMTFGLPVAQGLLFRPAACALRSGDSSAPAQARALAHWPDGSARWVLIDAPAPAGLGPNAAVNATVAFDPDAPPGNGLACETASAGEGATQARATQSRIARARITGQRLRVCVDAPASRLTVDRVEAGQWRCVLDQDTASLFEAWLADGRALKAGAIRNLSVEECGPERVSLRFDVPHEDARGVAHLNSVIRLHAYARQPFVKLAHRLEVISPELSPAAGGDETQALLAVRSFDLRLSWRHAQPPWRMVHEHDLAHRVEHGADAHTMAGRAAGQVVVPGELGALAVGVRHFWQTYPKGLRVDGQAVRVEWMPALTGEPLPGDEDAWHRLYFWLKDGQYLLKAGLALTNEVLIAWPEAGERLDAAFAWLEQPVVARPEINYLDQTQALGRLAPKRRSSSPRYERLADWAIDSFIEDQAECRAYGQVNFGDWYGESNWSWGNNEYDPAYCAYTEFLRGGDPRWAAWGAQSARHLADVDTVNFSSAPDQVGRQAFHMPGHLGGYLPPYFRSKIDGTTSAPSHTWVEGALLCHLTTGDEAVRESADRTMRWLLQDRWFDHYDNFNCRESGWHLIHLCALAAATGDPRCLNAASIIVQRVLDKQAPGGGWEHMLTESHCSCGYPRCRGEAGFMVGVLLSGLKRYHHLTHDEGAAQAIVGGARWLIRRTFDAAVGHFRYTSCDKRGHGSFAHTQFILEGLADAYLLSRDPEIGRHVRDGLKTMGMFPEEADRRGVGKTMAMQMRYMPAVLAENFDELPPEADPSPKEIDR
jgi:hypothetical protein